MRRSGPPGWHDNTRRPGAARSKHALQGLALVGVLFVVGSAAVWGRSITWRNPAVTVTLPPPRVAIHEPVRPATLERLAPRSNDVEQAREIFKPGAQVSRKVIRATWRNLAELIDTTHSRYTSLEPASCATVKETAPNARLSRRCEGVAGYALEMTDIEGQPYLTILTPNGERSELELPYTAADRSLGKLAEWRAQDTSAPRAVIVRVSVAGKPAASSLIVAKLGATPCIVAVIPRERNQNEKARRVADRQALTCRTS